MNNSEADLSSVIVAAFSQAAATVTRWEFASKPSERPTSS